MRNPSQHRPGRSLRLAAAAAAAALVVPAAIYLSSGAASAAAANLLGNSGFESGSLSGWTCDSGTASAVTSPVHSGSYALAGTPASSDDAQCTQTVSVQPNTTYTLSAYVEGSYVYLGDTGGGDTWTPSATSWQQLSMPVTTGTSQTSMTICIHGWYAQPAYHADDFSLTAGTTSTGSPTASSTGTPTGSSSPTASASPTPTGTGTVGGGSVGKVAPYVDMSNNQEPMLDSAAQAGLTSYTAAFVISSGCTPIWGDTLPVTSDPAMDQAIATAKADGATPIVSFGGEGGTELAMACSTESSLQAAYQSVITHLGVSHIDFDIEGAPLDYTSDNDLRFKAIAALEAANPGLVVSVTLPVLPTGLAADGVAFLDLAKQDGARIDLVNVMAMDYGSSFTGDMGQEAIQAAQNTLTQVQADWPGDTYADIGVTPMIGQNDNSAEVFSEADARTLVNWAGSAHLGRLAFWSVDRDQPCSGSASGLPSCSEVSQSPLDFTKIFDSYSG
jgi:hypothetical protein